MEKYIKIKNLKKVFNKKKVIDLKEISFEKGKVSYLLGENGAGKSTLLNIISQIDDEYKGEVISGLSRSEISLVDANPYMLKGTVYDNLAYPLKIRKYKDIGNKIKNLVEIFNIESLLLKTASKLSSGETQKVAIVRALSFNPKLLLLDEPTANLDKDAKLELIEIVKKYNQKKNTVIIVTHDHNFFKKLDGQKVILEKLK